MKMVWYVAMKDRVHGEWMISHWETPEQAMLAARNQIMYQYQPENLKGIGSDQEFVEAWNKFCKWPTEYVRVYQQLDKGFHWPMTETFSPPKPKKEKWYATSLTKKD